MEMQSFSAFAPTPDTAGAYLGGIGAAQHAQQIAQQAAQAQQALQLKQQQLAQEAQQNAMEIQVKQQQLQQESLRRDQELKIEAEYKQQQTALERAKVQQAQQVLEMHTQQAAREFQAQQQFKTDYDRLTSGEDAMSPNEAFRTAMFKNGINLPSEKSAMAQLARPDDTAQLGQQFTNDQGTTLIQTGRGQVTPLTPAGLTPQMQQAETAAASQRATEKSRMDALSERKSEMQQKGTAQALAALEKQQSSDKLGMAYSAKKLRGNVKLTPDQEAKAVGFIARQAKIDELTKQLQGEVGNGEDTGTPEREYKSAKDVPVGEVYKGHRRLKGDWNNPKSWETVQ